MDNKNILNETFAKHLNLLKEKLQLEQEPTQNQNEKPSSDVNLTPQDAQIAKQKVDAAYKQPLAGFTAAMQKAMEDPKVKSFLNAAKSDGASDDDQVEVTGPTPILVNKLKASQDEVFLDKSLAFPMKKDPKQGTQYILDGKHPNGMGPIVISGDVVIDGHHRWSQLFCMNPEGEVMAYNLQIKSGGKSVDDILKKSHLVVGAASGKIPTEDKGGEGNLFALKGDESTVKSWLKKNMSPEAITAFNDPTVVSKMKEKLNVPVSNPDEQNQQPVSEQETQSTPSTDGSVPTNTSVTGNDIEFQGSDVIVPYLMRSINAISGKKGAHPRKIMPQTGMPFDSKQPSVKPFVDQGNSGKTNLDFEKDSFKENRLNETFEKHIGLLRDYLKK